MGFNLNEGQGWVPVRGGGCVVRQPRMRDGGGYKQTNKTVSPRRIKIRSVGQSEGQLFPS